MDQDFNCPQCKGEIEVEVFRWNSKTSCPLCKTQLKVEYDFVVGVDEEEFDEWSLEIISEEESMELTYKFDYFLSASKPR